MERNIALKLMYNGTAYHGWQVQKNAVSVAETLGKGPGHGGVPPGQVYRGGAHRRRRPRGDLCGQLPHHLHASPATGIPLAVNTRLPEDIVVVRATEVPDGLQRHRLLP